MDKLFAEEPKTTQPSLRHAGFWIRFVASTVDFIVCLGLFFLAIPLALMAVKLGENLAGAPTGQATPVLVVAIVGLPLSISGLYQTLFVGWSGQTPGKALLGLKIIQTSGAEMTYSRAFARWIGRVLSGLLLGLGFLMIAWTKNKQGLHDKIANTYVIRL